MMFSRKNGQPLSEIEHIFQSIEMILSTPIGSRVMRRNFGSHLPRILGRPLNPSTITAIYAAANEAITTWEPRAEVVATQIDLEKAKAGIVNLRVILRVEGETVESDVSIT